MAQTKKDKPLAPEKIVEKEVLDACKHIGLQVDVIESKATYSTNLQRYSTSRSAPEGFPDLVGNDSQGAAVFVELKAKGKLRTLRPAQSAFLEKKIQSNCFAVCVDSGELLFELYLAWKARGREVLEAHLNSIR